MHLFKCNLKQIFSLTLIAMIVGINSYWMKANARRAAKKPEIVLCGGVYYLSFNIDYQLTDKSREALAKGIPLYWDILVRILRPRSWWWDETAVEKTKYYWIQYQVLVNRYCVTEVNSEISERFASLSSALAKMLAINDIALIEENKLNHLDQYQIAIKSQFDHEALLLPLRPFSYIDS